MKIAYLVHDLSDAAAVRRAQVLQAGGAALAVAGFRRTATPIESLAGVPALDLGQTFDGRLAHRASRVALTCARAGRLRSVVRGADVVLGRNLEMLALAAAARRLHAPHARLVYECLDIHRAMCGSGPAAAALRGLESLLLASCASVVVSAPAFVTEYFEKRHRRLPPMLLVENKVLAPLVGLERPAASARPPGAPWRIGWFGNLRCRKSLYLLQEIARRGQGRIEVVLRGRASTLTLPDLEARVAETPWMRFGGAYDQGDLGSIYGEVHFAWSIDYTDEGQNSDWALANRLYEGSFFNTPSIAEQGKAMGAWLTDKGAGLLVSEVVADTMRLLGALTPPEYAALEARTHAIDTASIAFDRESCGDLVAALGGSTHAGRSSWRPAPAGSPVA